MSNELPFKPEDMDLPSVSPFREMGAYEALWSKEGMSFRKIAQMRGGSSEPALSDFVDEPVAYEFADRARGLIAKSGIDRFGIRVYGTWDYLARLYDATYPVELLYFQGWWDLVYSRSVAAVGTRKPSREGIARTRRLVKNLVDDDFTVVSGLAAGIDTAAHTAAIENGGRTIAVLGTPHLRGISERERGVSETDRGRLPPCKPDSRVALLAARAARKPFFLSRTQHNYVGAYRGDCHCRGRRKIGNLGSGQSRAWAGKKTVYPRQLLSRLQTHLA